MTSIILPRHKTHTQPREKISVILKCAVLDTITACLRLLNRGWVSSYEVNDDRAEYQSKEGDGELWCVDLREV